MVAGGIVGLLRVPNGVQVNLMGLAILAEFCEGPWMLLA